MPFQKEYVYIDRDAVKDIAIKNDQTASLRRLVKYAIATAILVIKTVCSPKRIRSRYPQWKNLSVDSRRLLLSNLPKIIWRGVTRQFISGTKSIENPPTYKSARPAVSIIIPIFNQSTEILRAVKSVMNQTLSSVEVIIWNDGSTNSETLRILSEISVESTNSKDGRSVSVFSDKNQGVVGARNSASKVSNGKYLVFLDPDDSLEATYLEKAFLALESNVLCDIAVPDVRLIQGKSINYWLPESLRWPEICAYNHVPIASMITRELFDSVNGFDARMNGGWEDWDFWIRAAAIGAESVLLHEPLFNYTVSDTGRDAMVSEANRTDLLRILAENRPKKTKKPRIPMRTADLTEVIGSRQFNIFSDTSTNVVFFVPWLLKEGGAERFLRDLSEGLLANGFGVAFVITETERPNNSIDGVEAFRDLTPYIYDVKNIPNQSLNVFIQQVLNSPDIHSVVNVGSNALYDQLLINGITDKYKVVCDVLFNPIGHFKSHQKASDFFTDVVFVYEELKRIAERREIFRGRAHVIHVGIPVTETKEVSLSVTNIPMPQKLTFGWLGRFSTEKRPSWFLDLAKEFGSEANFVMAGTGPLLERYQAEGQGVEGLSVLGFISDPNDLYEKVDAVLNTSEIEGISVTAMEALDKGIPMIVTDVGGMGELVVDGKNGWVVSPSDYGDIESIVRQLIRDRTKVTAVKKRILESELDEKFNVTNMVQKYLGVLLPH